MQLFNGNYSDGQPFVGLWREGKAHDLTKALHVSEHPVKHAARSIDSLLDASVDLSALPSDAAEALDEGSFTFATPVRRPGKIIALVRNYRKHAEEFGAAPPPKMRWFAKFPSTMIPHGATLDIPDWIPGRVDHEVELGVIIGKAARNVSGADALSYVAGYTILNDVSARTLQKEVREETMPWMPAKNIEGFCPTGAFLTTADAIADPQNLKIRCSVNGELRQDGNTEEMLHPVAKIIHELSHWLSLEVGDIIATGTPAGVGPLEDGDQVECEIEGVGFLHHSVRSSR